MNTKRKQRHNSFVLVNSRVRARHLACLREHTILMCTLVAASSLVATLAQWCCAPHMFFVLCDCCTIECCWCFTPLMACCGHVVRHVWASCDGITVTCGWFPSWRVAMCIVVCCCACGDLNVWLARRCNVCLFSLRGYQFTEHVAFNGCHVLFLSEDMFLSERCRALWM